MSRQTDRQTDKPTDLHDPGDVAGSRATLSHLDDAMARAVWQWASIDERATELIHAAVPCHTHTVTVTQFCPVSMPVDFCRHLVGKTPRNVSHCGSA